ncbi:MAG: TetR family transcriptional regulator [Rhodopseudomonas sp.]|nr:TetR family transcriptional regulator [Rhodopseudomonas sp.]
MRPPLPGRDKSKAQTKAKTKAKTKAGTGPTRRRTSAAATARPKAVPSRPGAAATPVTDAMPSPRAARREAILAAALDEFSARGYEAARLDDVAKRAGIAKGTIYLYFRDKESLFQELVRAMLAPLIVGIERIGAVDMPAAVMAERFVDLFVGEVYQTRRQDVIRLMIAEGRRFPQLAEFYYREVLSRIIETVRGVLTRASKRGEVPQALIEFPQLIAAPGLIAIIWSGLFERFEPLDVRKMMLAHAKLMFAPGRAL